VAVSSNPKTKRKETKGKWDDSPFMKSYEMHKGFIASELLLNGTRLGSLIKDSRSNKIRV
jgi:hypothetical protein